MRVGRASRARLPEDPDRAANAGADLEPPEWVTAAVDVEHQDGRGGKVAPAGRKPPGKDRQARKKGPVSRGKAADEANGTSEPEPAPADGEQGGEPGGPASGVSI